MKNVHRTNVSRPLIAEIQRIRGRQFVTYISLPNPWRYNHTISSVKLTTKLMYCLHDVAYLIGYVG